MTCQKSTVYLNSDTTYEKIVLKRNLHIERARIGRVSGREYGVLRETSHWRVCGSGAGRVVRGRGARRPSLHTLDGPVGLVIQPTVKSAMASDVSGVWTCSWTQTSQSPRAKQQP
ncbi:unnamed protein product [Chrysodeixis includens]|uniref:Uncharacterized protein n=1 Tax=Chrysodeixis includens TaxID=689277 RepID=A0A9N8KYL1_CHRIL|nr:unnamed protein product [Chrysodeixis includens]